MVTEHHATRILALFVLVMLCMLLLTQKDEKIFDTFNHDDIIDTIHNLKYHVRFKDMYSRIIYNTDRTSYRMYGSDMTTARHSIEQSSKLSQLRTSNFNSEVTIVDRKYSDHNQQEDELRDHLKTYNYQIYDDPVKESLSRNLRNHDHWLSRVDPAFLGKRGIVGNITVFGAIVNSDVDVLHINPATLSPEEYEAKRMSFIRLENIRNLTAELPFELVHWPAVMTRPCPQNRHGHKTERGVALAHFQIWSDFIFFDHDVLDNLARGITNTYNSTSFSSTSGFFSANPTGELFKNGIPFLDDDILVVFEDDAESVVKDTAVTLIEELSSMTTDLLYLGWCEGRLARPVPLCTQAYALTRRGARKMVKYFEPCGMALDEQMVKICKNKWVSFRTVNDYSHKKNFKPGYPRYGDKTFGMFHQKKNEIPSINGH